MWMYYIKVSYCRTGNHGCNDLKLEIHSFAMNFNSRGLLSGYFVVNTGYWLSRSWEYCRLSLPNGWKYQMVKTQTVPQDEANSLNKRRQISVFFSFGVCRGMAEIYHEAVNFTVLLTLTTKWMENEEHFLKVSFIQRVLAKFSISNHMN